MAWRLTHVEANHEAARLEEAAALVRRYAGSLRYHPVTGLATPPGPAVTAALRRLRESLVRVPGWMRAFAAEAAGAEGTVGPVVAQELRDGQQRVQAQADLLRAALEVLERVLADPERVPLDAPYGLGSPRRAHPGAQATWVAERAEALARELVGQVVVRENLAAGSLQMTR